MSWIFHQSFAATATTIHEISRLKRSKSHAFIIKDLRTLRKAV